MALQDFARYIGISRHDPAYALRLDVAWFVLFVVAYLFLRSGGLVSLPWLFGAWTATGAAVGAWTLRAHMARRTRSALRFWLRSERAVGTRFAGQFLVTAVSNYIIFYLLALMVISMSDVGIIKLALLALGPVTVVSAGLQSALISLASKRFRTDRAKAMRFLFLAGIGMALATVLWSAALYVTPMHIAKAALGTTWPRARMLIPFGGLSLAIAAVAGAATSGLRALRAARENLRVAVAVLPVVLAVPMAGAALASTKGYVVAAAISSAVYALIAWLVLVRTSKSVELDALQGGAQAPPSANAPTFA
jgi:hypothetical protein